MVSLADATIFLQLDERFEEMPSRNSNPRINNPDLATHGVDKRAVWKTGWTANWTNATHTCSAFVKNPRSVLAVIRRMLTTRLLRRSPAPRSSENSEADLIGVFSSLDGESRIGSAVSSEHN